MCHCFFKAFLHTCSDVGTPLFDLDMVVLETDEVRVLWPQVCLTSLNNLKICPIQFPLW